MTLNVIILKYYTQPYSFHPDTMPDELDRFLKKGTMPDKPFIRCDYNLNKDKIIARIARALQNYPETDLVLGPEWLFLRPDIRDRENNRFNMLLSEQAKDEILDEICQKTKESPALIIPGTMGWIDANRDYRNTAYLIKKGTILGSYDKMLDGGDSKLALLCGANFNPGKDVGIFNINGVRVGIEICLDHHRDALRNSKQPRVDIHLIPLCYEPEFYAGTFSRYGGYTMLSDGAQSVGRIVRTDSEDDIRDLLTEMHPDPLDSDEDYDVYNLPNIPERK